MGLPSPASFGVRSPLGTAHSFQAANPITATTSIKMKITRRGSSSFLTRRSFLHGYVDAPAQRSRVCANQGGSQWNLSPRRCH